MEEKQAKGGKDEVKADNNDNNKQSDNNNNTDGKEEEKKEEKSSDQKASEEKKDDDGREEKLHPSRIGRGGDAVDTVNNIGEGVSSSGRSTFDTWQDDEEFSDTEGGTGGEAAEEEGEESTDDEEETNNRSNRDPYDDDYDRHGNRRKKKSKSPPITIDQIEKGMVLNIKPSKEERELLKKLKKSEAKQKSALSGDSDNKNAAKKKKEKKVGTVIKVDQMRRQVQLSIYNPDTASMNRSWFTINQLSKFKPRINADLFNLKSLETEELLLTAIRKELSLGMEYAKLSLFVVQQHAIAANADEKKNKKESSASISSSTTSELSLSLNDLGGAFSVLQCLRRTALDQFSSSPSSSSASVFEEEEDDSNEGGDRNNLSLTIRPLSVLRKYLIMILKRNDDEGASSSGDEKKKLSLLLKEEAIKELKEGINNSGDYLTQMRAKDHIDFGAFIVDLLLTVTSQLGQAKRIGPVKRYITKQFIAAGNNDAAKQLINESTGGSGVGAGNNVVPTVPIYDVDIYNALIDVIQTSKNMKDFKPSAQVQLVIPLVSRLLSKIHLFRSKPDITKIEWLQEKMKARYREEVKNIGNYCAVSKPLQSIINLMLVAEQAQKQLTNNNNNTEFDTSSKSSSLSSDEFDLGPDLTALPWFQVTAEISSIMKKIESGQGVPAWFLAQAFIFLKMQDISMTHESSHPYSQNISWTDISFPDAIALNIRIDPKSSSDQGDKLKFALPPSSSSSALSSPPSSLTEIAIFSGPSMAKSGVGPALNEAEEGGSSGSSNDDATKKSSGAFEIKGNKLLFSFEQSLDPAHPSVFCRLCDFPIRGLRLVCSSCDGEEGNPNDPFRRRYIRYDRDNAYNLCEACEKSNQDQGRHDRSHIFVVVRRPVPQGNSVPRVAPAVNHLYAADQLKSIRAGESDSQRSIHKDVGCSQCNMSPIIGIRYKCSYCLEYNLCQNCLTNTNNNHDRSHPFFKIRFPVRSSVGFNSMLKSFVDGVNENNDFYGFRFTVQPKYPASRYQLMLKESKSLIDKIIQQLTNEPDPSISINIYQQAVEIINRAQSKMVSTSADKKTQARRGERRKKEDSDPESLTLMLDPRSIVSSEKDLVVYSYLQNLTVDQVHLRMSALRLLNQRLLSVLPLIDWSQAHCDWSLSSIFGRLRGLVFSQMKTTLWRNALGSSTSRDHRGLSIVLDGLKASTIKDMKEENADPLDIIDASFFGQMLQQLRNVHPSQLRISWQPWNVRYKAEAGIDAGGLFRDSLSQVCQELQSDNLPLFIQCPNARHGVGITLDKYIPNKKCSNDIYFAMYQFIGMLMGVAIRTNNTLELDLPSLVWKQLVGQDLEVGDLAAIDEICVTAMQSLTDENKLKEKGVTEENFEDIYTFDFTYSSSDQTLIELKPNGGDIPVTWNNRIEYVELVLQYRLFELSPAIAAIRRGLCSVIPSRFLSMLTWKELELEVCGLSEVDLELLKSRTVYRGCGPTDPHIKYFWSVLEKFTQIERAQFLRFSWGRSRLPPPAKFVDKLAIDSTNISVEHLPRAHTCFFSIELPAYKSEEIMRDKLIKAITLCTSIDLT